MKKYIKVSILIDNPQSWFNEYLDKLFKVVRKYDPKFSFVKEARKLKKGDVLFILSCNRILTEKELEFHKNNIVVHASDLPKGRGWSPMTWQVESGKNKIPLTLFEADEECDAGDYYVKDFIKLDGMELIEDIRKKLADKIIQMIKKYLSLYPMEPIPQRERATYYRKRTPKDNELNINKSLKSQFSKMRVADNKRYPSYFRYKGKKYILKIYNADET